MKVHHTPTRNDPNHHTVQLPNLNLLLDDDS